MLAVLIQSTVLVFSALLPAVEVAETQSAPYSAELVSISATEVRVQQAGKLRSVLVDNLLRLSFKNATAVESTDSQPIVVILSDGTQISGSEVTSDSAGVTVISSGRTFTFSSRQVSSCLLRRLNPQLQKQWEALIESKNAADIVVLARADDALDKIEGVISKITPNAVSFDFDGQTIDAGRSKIAGVKFFSNDAALPGKLVAIVGDVNGNRWTTSALELPVDGASCQLVLQCGATVKLPIDDLRDIDFSFGNMRYLAEIEPLEQSSAPRLKLGIELPDSAKLFGLRSTQATSSTTLTGPSIEFIGSGTATYRIPAGFSKLVGSVELNPDGHKFAACRTAVLLENTLLWEHVFDAKSKPQEISLPIDSDKRLRLVVESEAEHPVGDIVIWKQLRFAK